MPQKIKTPKLTHDSFLSHFLEEIKKHFAVYHVEVSRVKLSLDYLVLKSLHHDETELLSLLWNFTGNKDIDILSYNMNCNVEDYGDEHQVCVYLHFHKIEN